uniref:Uncharacterized protein n=1 Tax=Ixodes ricinus TaxID=34613 RepID=A0A6B0TR38_IXORI
MGLRHVLTPSLVSPIVLGTPKRWAKWEFGDGVYGVEKWNCYRWKISIERPNSSSGKRDSSRYRHHDFR